VARVTFKERPKLKISDFEVGKKIGAGNFGVILRATAVKDKKEYALKVINKTQIVSREHAEHIVRERNILMYLSDERNISPFIVRAH